jgi:hypothetical protein
METFCTELVLCEEVPYRWTTEEFNLQQGQEIFASPKCPDQPWGTPSLLFSRLCGLFPCWRSSPGGKMTIHLCLVPS